MRRPEMKFGDFKIRYFQEPYIDRWIVINALGGEYKISGCKFKLFMEKINKFYLQVLEFDKYLNKDVK